jgi:hypothetical protein
LTLDTVKIPERSSGITSVIEVIPRIGLADHAGQDDVIEEN